MHTKHVLSFAAIILTIFSPDYIQGQEISFSSNPIRIVDAFKEIEYQTDFLISYPIKGLPLKQFVTFSKNPLFFKKALEEALQNTNHTFITRGKHILLVPAVTSQEEKSNTFPFSPTLPDTIYTDRMNEMNPISIKKREQELREYSMGDVQEPPPVPFLEVPVYPAGEIINNPVSKRPIFITQRPYLAIRTNLLYDFTVFTPNLEIETALSPHSTLLLAGSYNGWRNKGARIDNKKLWHWTVGAEYRYWLCERFNGHFFGVHGVYGQYNISGKKIPLLFEKGAEKYRYQGTGVVSGISYGYQFILGNNWNLELNAGIGAGVLKYDKWDCRACGEQMEKDITRIFVAPTKLGISIVYILK